MNPKQNFTGRETRLLYKSEQPMSRDAFKKVIEDSEQEEGKEEF